MSLSYLGKYEDKNTFEKRSEWATGILEYIFAYLIVMYVIIPADFTKIFEYKISSGLTRSVPVISVGFVFIFLLRIAFLQGINQKWLIIPDLCNLYTIFGYYFSNSVQTSLLERIQTQIFGFIVIIYYLLVISAIYYDALTGDKYYKQIIDEMQEKTKVN